jgi:hypothetical protein
MQITTMELGEEFKISFNLNVAGTSSQPSEVRVVIGDKLKLLTTAKLNALGEYEVKMPLLAELFAKGDIVLAIEVILNGKLFTPFKQRVTISKAEISVIAQSPKPETIIIPEKKEIKTPQKPVPPLSETLKEYEISKKINLAKLAKFKTDIKPEEKKEVVVENQKPKVIVQTSNFKIKKTKIVSR